MILLFGHVLVSQAVKEAPGVKERMDGCEQAFSNQ